MGSDRRFLVTGAGGQLGRAFARILPTALLLDRSALDVTDKEQTRKAIGQERPDVVIHSAASTKVDQAEAEPEHAAAVNVEGTRNVAIAAAQVGATLVYPSTDYVFDGEKTSYKEEDQTGPLSVYGRTKLKGERVVLELSDHLIVRTSWVFGEGHNFIKSILTAAESRSTLTIVDDQRGIPTYAVDLAEGILGLLHRGAQGIYHLSGGGEPCTWADLAEEAIRLAGSGAQVERVSTEDYLASQEGPVAKRPARSVLDCSKAAELGVTLRRWPEAVSDYVKESL